MRKPTAAKCLQFLFDVIFNAPNRYPAIIQQQIRGAAVAIIRKANAAAIGNSSPADTSDIRSVDVTVDNNIVEEWSVDRFQICIARIRSRRAPKVFGTGVYERDRIPMLDPREIA